MRDYVKFFFAAESPPDPISDFPQFFVCMTEEDATNTAAGMTPVFSGQIITGKFALRLKDRTDIFSVIANLNTVFKVSNAQISFNFDGPRGGSEYRGEGVNSVVEKTGAKSLKTADFSGAQGLLDALAALPALAAQLTKQGRLRDANIVLGEYNLVIAGKISITEAFDKLSKLGIL